MSAVQPPAPEIAPAEALIVVTGLEPFLRHTSRDLTGAIVRSEQLPEAIEAKIYRFINRDEREPPADLPAFDFDTTVELLDTPPADGAIARTMGAFGSHHQLAMDVGTQVTRILGYVRQQIPRRTHMGLSGPEPMPPARSELARFRRCWRVAAEPMSILDDLQEYAVARDQVACFAAMFPTVFPTFWPTVQQALVRKRMASEGWLIPRHKEILLRVLGQQEAPSLALARALSSVYAAEMQQQAATQQQRTAKASASMASEGTDSQKLDAAM